MTQAKRKWFPGSISPLSPPHRHAVWPTPVPSNGVTHWDHADRIRFEDMNRPKDYHGDRYDQMAWDAYAAIKEAEHVERVRLRIITGAGR